MFLKQKLFKCISNFKGRCVVTEHQRYEHNVDFIAYCSKELVCQSLLLKATTR